MSNVMVFRLLILVQLAINLIWLGGGLSSDLLMRDEALIVTSDLLDLVEGRGRLLTLPWWADHVVIAANILGLIGLIFFRNWARWVLLGTLLLFIVQSVIHGSRVIYPSDSLLSLISGTAFGATMGLAFFSDVRSRFRNQSAS